MNTQATELWTAQEAASATQGEAVGDWIASGVSIDTRTLNPGDLFTALRGPNHDGHDHVKDALEKGAAAAVVERKYADAPAGAGLLCVDDTEQALRDLAAQARKRTSAQICGVTGSVGKTGTKELLAAALGAQGKVSATAGNLNNHFGLPLSLARMPSDSDYGVFEMGMNHAGEISPLSKLARPHVAMIMNVEAVHIEYFDGIEGIADAKSEIFDGLVEGGTAVISRDTPFFNMLADRARACGAAKVWGFGVHSLSNARFLAADPTPTGQHVQASIGSKHLKYHLNMRGRHWAINTLGVLAAVASLGADLDAAAQAFITVKPPKGRGRAHTIKSEDGLFTIIDETYNASPVAVRAAMNVLKSITPGRGGRRVVVLGDMLELGDDVEKEHMSLVNDITAHDFDLVFACGQHMPGILAGLPDDMRGGSADNSDDLAGLVTKRVRSGDLVLIKGSFGSQMGKVIDRLKAMDISVTTDGEA
ncbi:UDP-N-acetylmuramoyl-tripeptide--D-alanyl-D-alanine ligase [Rhodospirillales bacterium]|nr:UDP-N-acetylmuramoyl-tripeptide--D-alanyl-D-alanine ligase [Rhodospirillales bacterium]